MDQKEIIARITEKVTRLSESRAAMQRESERLIQENERLFAINKELQKQVDELAEKSRDLEKTRSLQGPVGETTVQARQRINELVREIDECITLLNK